MPTRLPGSHPYETSWRPGTPSPPIALGQRLARPAAGQAQRAAAAPGAAGEAADAVRARGDGAAEYHQRRGWCPDAPVLGDGGADRGRGRAARRADDGDLVQRAVRGVRLPRGQPPARRGAGAGRAAGRLAAGRGGVRRGGVVFAAPAHPGRAVGDRRGAVERRRAAVVPPLPGLLGDLRGRHRDGRLDRPGSRAQAAGRRVRQRAGRPGRPDGDPAAAAGGVRRRCRAGRGLQRPAGRRPVHRGDPDRQHHPAGDAAGHRLLGDRHRDRLGVPAGPGRLPRHPGLPVHLVGDDLGGAGRPGHRAGLGRLHPAHRLGLAPPAARGTAALAGRCSPSASWG